MQPAGEDPRAGCDHLLLQSDTIIFDLLEHLGLRLGPARGVADVQKVMLHGISPRQRRAGSHPLNERDRALFDKGAQKACHLMG
jgi:hypothetical protein